MPKNKQQPLATVNERGLLEPSLKEEIREGHFGVYQNALTQQLEKATKNITEDISQRGTFKATQGRLQLTSMNLTEKDEEGNTYVTETGGQILECNNNVVTRVLLAMREQLYNDGLKEGSLNVRQYAEKCDISYKKAKLQVRESLKVLYHIDVYDPITGFHNRVIQSYGERISRDYQSYVFSDAFYEYLVKTKRFFNEISKEFYKIDLQRHSNSQNILLKYYDRRRQNSNILSVKTLLACCSYPSYESIKATGEVDRKIISAFEDDLDYLVNFFTWSYCHANGRPRTLDEIMREYERGLSYSEFINLNVIIAWKDETNYDIGNIRARYARKQELKQQRAYKNKMKKLAEKEAELELREQALLFKEEQSSTADESSDE